MKSTDAIGGVFWLVAVVIDIYVGKVLRSDLRPGWEVDWFADGLVCVVASTLAAGICVAGVLIMRAAQRGSTVSGIPGISRPWGMGERVIAVLSLVTGVLPFVATFLALALH